MAASAAGIFSSSFCALSCTARKVLNFRYPSACTILQTRDYAARKGTREKARKKKVKHVVEKIGFIPHNQRGVKKTILPVEKIRFDDAIKDEIPEDDVWIGKYHRMKTYTLAEAIECHKETHSLGMLDKPDAFVKAKIELDMTGLKPSRPVTKFTRIAAIPHVFNHGETRCVLAFCKSPELQEEAKKAGAELVGGPELIPMIQRGEINLVEYTQTVAHPNMMADLIAIKGLLKKKFPLALNGSLGIDVPGMVSKFLHGVTYSGHPHERQPLCGLAEAPFGRLNMETKQLEENFAAVIADMDSFRPKRPGAFIWRIRITTEIDKEYLKIDRTLYAPDIVNKKDEVEDDDDVDEPVSVAI